MEDAITSTAPTQANAARAAKTREEKRVAPEEVAEHARRQGTDAPSIPRGRTKGAKCENRDRPGHIDKTNDC